MSEQELDQLDAQELADQAIALKQEAKAIEAKYEDEKKSAFEKHKSVTSHIKSLVQPLLDNIELIKDSLAQWRSSHATATLDGVSFRQGKFQIVSHDLELLVKKAAEDKSFMRYLSLNEKIAQKTIDDREEFHGIPGVIVKRGPDVVVLKGEK